jgi:hypothetical protein
MNEPEHANLSKRLFDAIDLARIRLARAQSRWELADGQAHLARRRRKEAKHAARRAKKQAREAMHEFADAQEALAAAEDKFTEAVKVAANERKALASARVASKRSGASAAKTFPRTASVQPALSARRKVGRTAALSGGHPARPSGEKRETSNTKSAGRKHVRTGKSSMPTAKGANVHRSVARPGKPILIPRDFESSQGAGRSSPGTIAEAAAALVANVVGNLKPSAAKPSFTGT